MISSNRVDRFKSVFTGFRALFSMREAFKMLSISVNLRKDEYAALRKLGFKTKTIDSNVRNVITNDEPDKEKKWEDGMKFLESKGYKREDFENR